MLGQAYYNSVRIPEAINIKFLFIILVDDFISAASGGRLAAATHVRYK